LALIAASLPPGKLEADREVANRLADLIIGGLLVSGIEDQADEDNRAGEACSEQRLCTNRKQKAGSLFGTGLCAW
jgi:hypothetical protein